MVDAGYVACVDDSIRVQWQIDELLPKSQRLDFSRPHLPEALVNIRDLDFLSQQEKMALNHIRGHAYMNLFGFVEEYIIPLVVRHAEAELFGDQQAVRALLRFAEEEVKHQTLFRRYCDLFRAQFGSPSEVLDQSIAVAQIILGKSPMAAMLVTLHLELITQKHYVSAVKDDGALDGLFSSILKHHWLEEAQHAKIDILELEKMTEGANPTLIEEALDHYFEILGAFDGLLGQQVDMDSRSLEKKTGRSLTADQRAKLRRVQVDSYRADFILMGVDHPTFTAKVKALSSSWDERVAKFRKQLA